MYYFYIYYIYLYMLSSAAVFVIYCNCLLYGVGDGLLKKLQAVQNAAARVVAS